MNDDIIRFRPGNILELGGGKKPLRNQSGNRLTTNMDIMKAPSVDIVHDIGGVFPWPVEDNSYDNVFAKYCLEHISWRDIKQAVKEIYRVLRKNGKVIVNVPNTFKQCELIVEKGVDQGTIEMLFGSQECPNHAGVHKCAFSPSYAKKLFEESGFNFVKTFPHPVSNTDLIIEAYKIPEGGIFEREYFEDGTIGYKNYRDFATHYATARAIIATGAKSVIDAGGARGYLVKLLENEGIHAVCMDISRHCWHNRATDSFILWDAMKTPWKRKIPNSTDSYQDIGDKEFELCCHPNTLIEIEDGCFKKIKDIIVGDKVLAHTGNYRKVKKIFKRYFKGKLYSIQPYYFNFPVLVTGEHPIFAKKVRYRQKRYSQLRHTLPEPAWIQSNKLTDNDVVMFPINKKIKDIEEIVFSKKFFNKQHPNYKLYKKVIKMKSEGYTYDKIKEISGIPRKTAHQWVKDIKRPRGCYFIENGKAHIYPGTQGILNNIKINGDFCRFVGYYLSDGCIDLKTGHLTIVFNKNEEEYFKDVKNIVSKIFRLRINKYLITNTITIKICSKELTLFIKDIINDGIKRYALTKQIPSWMMTLPIEKQKQLIIGLFRGDGTVGKDSYRYVTSSIQLLNQIKNILLRLGVIPSVRKHSDAGKVLFKDNHVANSAPSYTIGISGKYTTIFKNDFKEIKKRSTSFNYGWINDNFAMLPIRKIKPTSYEGDVFNLEIEKDNSYVSSCILHNCFSINFLEHIPEDKVEDIIREMVRASKGGLHGIHFTESPYKEMDKDIDITHQTVRSESWWRDKFKQIAPDYNVVLKHPRMLEYEQPERQLPITMMPEIKDTSVKLNLGSFLDCFYYGWWNLDIIDLHDFANAQKYRYKQCDVTKGLQYDDNSVDLIISNHLIEHLTKDEGFKLLKECHRVMKKDAVIRISTPDTLFLSKEYANGNIMDYRVMNVGVENADSEVEAYCALLLAGHKYLYDGRALDQMLKKAGFQLLPKVTPFTSNSEKIKKETITTHPTLSYVSEAKKP